MLEAGDRFRLGAKPLEHSGRRALLDQDHLHRHLPLRSVLDRAVDNAHPATSDLFDQIITESVIRSARALAQRCIQQADRTQSRYRSTGEVRVATSAAHRPYAASTLRR